MLSGGAVGVGLVAGWLAGRARADAAVAWLAAMAAEVAWLGDAGAVAWFAAGSALALVGYRLAVHLVTRRVGVLT